MPRLTPSSPAMQVSLMVPASKVASNEMKVQEEYLVYNEVDLVGIVGGNLGLFVGFSFFEKVKQIINFFIDKI